MVVKGHIAYLSSPEQNQKRKKDRTEGPLQASNASIARDFQKQSVTVHDVLAYVMCHVRVLPGIWSPNAS